MENKIKIPIKGKGEITKGMNSNEDSNIIEDQIVTCSDNKTRQLSKIRPDLIGRQDIIDDFFEFIIEEKFEDEFIGYVKYDFGYIIKALKNKKKVAREGWNGKNMYLLYCEGRRTDIATVLGHNKLQDNFEGQNALVLPFIVLKTADDKLVPWNASQPDVLAEDWIVLN